MSELDIGLLISVGVGFTGWMGWMSKTLSEIKSITTSNTVTLKDHERRIEELEDLAPRHIV